MSHFSVGVFIPKAQFTCSCLMDVQNLIRPYLAPFEEHESTGSCDPKYLEHIDRTAESIDEYFDTHTKILVDGKLENPWAKQFQREATPEEIELIKSGQQPNLQYKAWHDEYTILNSYPENAKEIEVPYCYDELFPDYFAGQYSDPSECFVKFGEEPKEDVTVYVQEIVDAPKPPAMLFNEDYELENEKEIREFLMRSYRVYNVTNPNSKWDWYEVGGRWNSGIPLLSGDEVNWAPIRAIKFEPDLGIYQKLIRKWEVIVDKSPLTPVEEEIQEKDHFAFRSLFNERYFTEYYGTKENYATIESSFVPYAFVTEDKKWVSAGEVGWFGTATNEKKSNEEYRKKFKEYVESRDQNDYLIIVDCHI